MNKENKPQPVHFFTLHNSFVLLLCLICLVFYILTANELLKSVSAQEQIATRHESYLSILEGRKRANTPPAPAYIKGWMTFAYINHLYGLPPTYLQTSLRLSDPSFPNISLNEYAENYGLSKTQFLKEVIGKVTALQPLAVQEKASTTVPLTSTLLPEPTNP